MNHYINKTLAQQIVDTVKDLCGQNVNFIDCSGTIFASTDKQRIGDFHEIGRQAAMSRKVIEVSESDRFTGTQKGVNLPICHNQEIIAVIGITGNPEEVRKFAQLAERITRLLIREKELDDYNRTEAEKKSHILRELIDQKEIHPDYLKENLKKWELSEDQPCHLIRLLLQNHSPSTASDSRDVVSGAEIHQLFHTLDARLYTFLYPNQYLFVLEHSAFLQSRHILKAFAEKNNNSVFIGVGNAVPIRRLSQSAFEAESALQSLEYSENTYAEFSDLTLELILSCTSSKNREAYLKKTIQSLPQRDRELLETYFQCNMSLKETSEKTFLHKNTLQYRLNQIHRQCGYNPRCFQDAVILYLAFML